MAHAPSIPLHILAMYRDRGLFYSVWRQDRMSLAVEIFSCRLYTRSITSAGHRFTGGRSRGCRRYHIGGTVPSRPTATMAACVESPGFIATKTWAPLAIAMRSAGLKVTTGTLVGTTITFSPEP